MRFTTADFRVCHRLHRYLARVTHPGLRVRRIRRWLHDLPTIPADGTLSWITHVAMGVLMGCDGILLYLAALMQQGG